MSTKSPHKKSGLLLTQRIRFWDVLLLVLTGNKLTDKLYTRHTGYPGGQRHTSPAAVLKVHPERVIEHAVRGMLPKNRLGRAVLKNLHLYAGTEHKHEAQQPKVIDLNSLN